MLLERVAQRLLEPQSWEHSSLCSAWNPPFPPQHLLGPFSNLPLLKRSRQRVSKDRGCSVSLQPGAHLQPKAFRTGVK